MHTLHKFIVSLATVLAICFFPTTIQAAKDQTINLNISHVNPLYADIITEEDLLPATLTPQATYSEPDYVTTVEEAGYIMRQQMKDRIDSVLVYIQTTDASEDYLTDLSYQISDHALKHTGNPIEGDYLKWQFGGWTVNISGSGSNGIYQLTYTYAITYYTTAEQEQYMNTAIDELLTTLDISSAADYDKIYAILK